MYLYGDPGYMHVHEHNYMYMHVAMVLFYWST